MVRNSKKEPGGGIPYAMYFVAIVFTLVLFVFLKFNADLFMIEDELENGLHVAQMRIVTTSFDEKSEVGMRNDLWEREANRRNIVTKMDPTTSSFSGSEKAQVEKVAEAFAAAVQDELGLVGGSHPSRGELLNMCGGDANISIKSARIIEPVYVKNANANDGGTVLFGGAEVPKVSYVSDYWISEWIVYDISYSEGNGYVSSGKSLQSSAPVLANGSPAEGATVEATIGAQFNGVRNIFAQRNNKSYEEMRIEGYYDFGPQYNNLTAAAINYEGEDTPIFSEPVDTRYDIEVTQAVDAVIAAHDSRTQ